MFTRATKDFGIWRENHNSRRRFSGRPTSGFVMALALSALVAWLAFILVWKVRGDFFLLESAQLPLPRTAASDVLFSSRPCAVSVAIIASKNPGEGVSLLFDSGKMFAFPSQEKELLRYLDERVDTIEYMSMLTMSSSPSVSRVQIWPDRKLGRKDLNAVIRVFAEKGFDDFDIAMQVEGKS